ncbi:MAG: ABC transporter ATP-binding protein [Patescibacteria group bacterium]
MLKVKNLNVLHPAGQELVDISFAVEKGTVTAVIGRTDSGKSVLGRVIADQYIEHDGEIIINHLSRRHESAKIAYQLGYAPAEPLLENYLTGYEQIDFIASFFEISPAERSKKIIELAKTYNATNALYRLIEQLSGADRKKISLISSLVHAPSVVVWDEPTSHLDPFDQQIVYRQLAKMKDDKMAVLLITNDLTLVSTSADQIIILENGQIKMSGNVSQLKNQTSSKTNSLAEILARSEPGDVRA